MRLVHVDSELAIPWTNTKSDTKKNVFTATAMRPNFRLPWIPRILAMFRASVPLRCQLSGVKTDRVAVVDRLDLRKKVGLIEVLWGILTLPVIGLGLLLLLPGIHLLALSARHDRGRFFYGANGAMPLPVAEVARI